VTLNILIAILFLLVGHLRSQMVITQCYDIRALLRNNRTTYDVEFDSR